MADQAFDIPQKSDPGRGRSPFRQTTALDRSGTTFFAMAAGRMVAMHRLALKRAQNPCL
jgi:hypothetical protein